MSFETLNLLILLVLAGGALFALSQSRDPLHPAVVITPLFAWMYAVWPTVLNLNGELEKLLRPEHLTYTAMLYLCGTSAFMLGMVYQPNKIYRQARNVGGVGLQLLDSGARQRLTQMGLAFAVIANASYWYTIFASGGIVAVYGKAKGGAYGFSGFIGEAALLGLGAVLIVALARHKRFRIQDFLLMLFAVLPQLTHGTLGGRRGPIFLTLLVLFFGWVLARGKRPTSVQVAVAVGVACFAVLFNFSQRQEIYLGSDGSFSIERMVETLAPEDIHHGNTYVTGVAAIAEADYFDNFYWGKRFLVTFFIRPIPSAIWPTKYRDVGADWVLHEVDKYQASEQFLQAAGVYWIAGAAMPSIADVYKEFWWGAVPFFYGLGLLFSFVWRRHITIGGYWTIINFLMIMLSVYLASQSFSAWGVRLLIIGVPTVLLWKYWVGEPPQRPPIMTTSNPKPRHAQMVRYAARVPGRQPYR